MRFWRGRCQRRAAAPETKSLADLKRTPTRSRRTDQMAEETIVLKVFATEMDATMAQDVLHDEGLKAFVFKDDAGGMEPHLQRTNGVRLVVKGSDAERARKILEPLLSILIRSVINARPVSVEN